jgi:hypothetical protein
MLDIVQKKRVAAEVLTNKSNYAPVYDDQDAIDMARMRR